MKKALSIFLALTLLLSSLNFVYAEETVAIETIGSADEFISKLTANPSGSFILTADITLSAGFTGTFTGKFNGNNRIITIGSATTPATQGVFATLGNGAVIENLIVDGAVTANVDAGGIAGAAATSATVKFVNCVNFATVKSATGGKRLGGILGTAYGATNAIFENCINYGTIRQDGWSNSAAGGIVGMATKAEITNCVNYADVYSVFFTGGMIGWVYNNLTVSGSANFGKIDSYKDYKHSAGILGYAQANSSISVSSCYNSGSATSGVVKQIGSGVTLKIANFVNTGTVTNAIATGKTDETDNYYLEGSATDSNGATAKTAAELAAIEGFSVQSNYAYPLPAGITYKTVADFKKVTISTADDFQAIRCGWSYTLANNIDLNTINFTAIPSFDNILDGAGYTITIGIDEKPAAQGLFVSLKNGAEIKNLTVDGVITASGNAGAFAKGIAVNSTVKFTNCINLAPVKASASGARIAGFVGDAYQAGAKIIFENCSNYGTIYQSGWGGSAAGGFVGISSKTELTNCVNYADVYSVYYAGGMVGRCMEAISANNCANFGAVDSYYDNDNGGFVGYVEPNKSITISDSYNAGKSTSGFLTKIGAGAICTINNCINTGIVTNAIAAGTTGETDNYYLEGSATNSNDAVLKSADGLKNDGEIKGFAKQSGYDYVLPSGITYTTKEALKIVVINSADEFVSKISADPSASFKLGADITLASGYNGTFTGSFNGNGYKITIGTEEAPASQGVFATLGNGAVIENLTVDGAVTAKVDAGGIAGAAATSATVKFANCVNFATVKSATSGKRLGGILGTAYGATNAIFENCINYGTIRQEGWSNSAAGGIVGMATKAEITNCVNYADVYSVFFTGGMIGWVYNNLTVSGSANFGKIDSYKDYKHSAGILGYAQANSSISVSSCYNSGSATSGVVKQIGSGVTLKIANFVNTGTVTNAIATGKTDETDNYYLEGSATDSNGATAKTSAQLQMLELNNYKKQSDYLYPIPEGITYIAENELNYIEIKNASEFVSAINADKTKAYILTADIDLSSVDYAAISGFEGVLNGNGHKINLGDTANGLFASVGNATIKNLTVEGNISGSGHKGGFANVIMSGKTAEFINLNNYVSINTSSDNARAGGIVGNALDGTIKVINCTNYANIQMLSSVQVGAGIVGIALSPVIVNCVNYGSIYSVQRAGGILGWAYGTAIDIKNCSNFGTVYSEFNSAGGILGEAANGSNGTIYGCINGGIVNGVIIENASQYFGGILGRINASNYTSQIKIKNCVNAGTTVNAITNANTGNISGCYYLENSGTDVTNSTVKTAEELKILELTDFVVPEGIYDASYPVPVVADIKTVSLEIVAGNGGNTSPEGTITVVYNKPVDITAIPNENYIVKACSLNMKDIEESAIENVYTVEVTTDSVLEISFMNLDDIDVNEGLTMVGIYDNFNETVHPEWKGRYGSIMAFAKAIDVKPFSVEECGILFTFNTDLDENTLIYDKSAVDVKVLKADLVNNPLTSNGGYGILIFNTQNTECKSYKIRAYAKYSNGDVAYSDLTEGTFIDRINGTSAE